MAMRWTVLVAAGLAAASAPRPAAAGPTPVRCDNLSTAELAIDGLLDDWPRAVLARAGVPSDGAIALRCSWDGRALALSLDVADDRLIRIPSGQFAYVTLPVARPADV